MFFQVLAISAAIGAHTPTSAQAPAILEAIPADAYVVDCLVSGQALTDCKVVDADPSTNARAATALRLAAQIQVPESLAAANPGRIKIKLNVNP